LLSTGSPPPPLYPVHARDGKLFFDRVLFPLSDWLLFAQGKHATRPPFLPCNFFPVLPLFRSGKYVLFGQRDFPLSVLFQRMDCVVFFSPPSGSLPLLDFSAKKDTVWPFFNLHPSPANLRDSPFEGVLQKDLILLTPFFSSFNHVPVGICGWLVGAFLIPTISRSFFLQNVLSSFLLFGFKDFRELLFLP